MFLTLVAVKVQRLFLIVIKSKLFFKIFSAIPNLAPCSRHVNTSFTYGYAPTAQTLSLGACSDLWI
nr:hypothetical protein Q903MT_gene3188 [Picea sitchensis]